MDIFYITSDNEKILRTMGYNRLPEIADGLSQYVSASPVIYDKEIDTLSLYVDEPALRDWIKQIRKARHWTQEKLATLSGISVQYVSQIERKFINPSHEVLKDIVCTLLFSNGLDGMETFIPSHHRNHIELALARKEGLSAVKDSASPKDLDEINRILLAGELTKLLEDIILLHDATFLECTKSTLEMVKNFYNVLSLATPENELDGLIEEKTNTFRKYLSGTKSLYFSSQKE